ncbi:MAG: YdcF family protein [Paracoccaceae bacterium]
MGVIWWILRWGVRLGLVVLALTFGAVLWTSADVRQATEEGRALAAPVDAVIVLGAGVEGDGRLAYNSRRRTAAAVSLLKAGQTRAIIFAGGLGKYHPTTPAAALMRDHALELGAEPEALFVEPRSISTFENLRFSFEIAETEGLDRLALVSDAYHLPRAGALADYFGRPNLPLVAAPGFERDWWPERLTHLLRESLAWWFNLLKVAGWEGLARLGLAPDERSRYVR